MSSLAHLFVFINIGTKSTRQSTAIAKSLNVHLLLHKLVSQLATWRSRGLPQQLVNYLLQQYCSTPGCSACASMLILVPSMPPSLPGG